MIKIDKIIIQKSKLKIKSKMILTIKTTKFEEMHLILK